MKLTRNQANSALLADWEAVTTTHPVGVVVFNEVQFRDTGSSVVNTLFIANQYNFASIFNVSNAVGYEVSGHVIGHVTVM